MKRANLGSALLAAPLIITGSLFAGSAAMADQAQTVALQLDSECIVSSTSTGYFALQNKNDFAVTAHYNNTDNGAMGDISVPANSFYLYPVSIDLNNHNNQTVFTADGWTSPNSTNAHMDVECRDDQIARFAPVASTGSDNGGSTTTPTDNGSDTGVVGGKGGEAATTTVATPATTNTAATLADTGASQILPFTAAAILAVAVLGTTVAVRRNVL